MRNKKRLWNFVIIIIIISILLIASLMTFLLWSMKDTVLSFSQDVMAITSLGIAMVALIVALITYFSIDSVSTISSMAGNVLENSNYTIESAELIRAYQNVANQEEFTAKLLSDMTKFLNKHNATCMEYADSIQYIIDRLVWCAYMDHNAPRYKKAKDKLLNKLDKSYLKYSKISNGIQYTLQEHVKLIRCILEYQKDSANSNYGLCKIVNVRGRMIRNSVSRTLYYDYLGLTYLKQALKVMSESSNRKVSFSVPSMKYIRGYDFTEEELDKIKLLLNIAENALEEAKECVDKDILWEGYIMFNLVRVYVVRFLIRQGNVKDDKLLRKLKEVIAIRRQVCSLYNDSDGHLEKRLKEEIRYAVDLYENVRQVLGASEKG